MVCQKTLLDLLLDTSQDHGTFPSCAKELPSCLESLINPFMHHILASSCVSLHPGLAPSPSRDRMNQPTLNNEPAVIQAMKELIQTTFQELLKCMLDLMNQMLLKIWDTSPKVCTPTPRRLPDPLSPEERARRQAAGLCWYCADPSHWLANCPVRPQKKPVPAQTFASPLPKPAPASKGTPKKPAVPKPTSVPKPRKLPVPVCKATPRKPVPSVHHKATGAEPRYMDMQDTHVGDTNESTVSPFAEPEEGPSEPVEHMVFEDPEPMDIMAIQTQKVTPITTSQHYIAPTVILAPVATSGEAKEVTQLPQGSPGRCAVATEFPDPVPSNTTKEVEHGDPEVSTPSQVSLDQSKVPEDHLKPVSTPSGCVNASDGTVVRREDLERYEEAKILRLTAGSTSPHQAKPMVCSSTMGSRTPQTELPSPYPSMSDSEGDEGWVSLDSDNQILPIQKYRCQPKLQTARRSQGPPGQHVGGIASTVASSVPHPVTNQGVTYHNAASHRNPGKDFLPLSDSSSDDDPERDKMVNFLNDVPQRLWGNSPKVCVPAKEKPRASLSAEERTRRKTYNLCLYCGEPSHWVVDCPSRPPKKETPWQRSETAPIPRDTPRPKVMVSSPKLVKTPKPAKVLQPALRRPPAATPTPKRSSLPKASLTKYKQPLPESIKRPAVPLTPALHEKTHNVNQPGEPMDVEYAAFEGTGSVSSMDFKPTSFLEAESPEQKDLMPLLHPEATPITTPLTETPVVKSIVTLASQVSDLTTVLEDLRVDYAHLRAQMQNLQTPTYVPPSDPVMDTSSPEPCMEEYPSSNNFLEADWQTSDNEDCLSSLVKWHRLGPSSQGGAYLGATISVPATSPCDFFVPKKTSFMAKVRSPIAHTRRIKSSPCSLASSSSPAVPPQEPLPTSVSPESEPRTVTPKGPNVADVDFILSRSCFSPCKMDDEACMVYDCPETCVPITKNSSDPSTLEGAPASIETVLCQEDPQTVDSFVAQSAPLGGGICHASRRRCRKRGKTGTALP